MSRIKGLEDENGRLSTEKETVVAFLNNYEVGKKNPERKL